MERRWRTAFKVAWLFNIYKAEVCKGYDRGFDRNGCSLNASHAEPTTTNMFQSQGGGRIWSWNSLNQTDSVVLIRDDVLSPLVYTMPHNVHKKCYHAQRAVQLPPKSARGYSQNSRMSAHLSSGIILPENQAHVILGPSVLELVVLKLCWNPAAQPSPPRSCHPPF